MKTVYLLQHSFTDEHSDDHVRTIGIYITRALAEAAVCRLRTKPGFRNFPALVDNDADDFSDGFYIDEYELDRDYCDEGFIRLSQDS